MLQSAMASPVTARTPARTRVRTPGRPGADAPAAVARALRVVLAGLFGVVGVVGVVVVLATGALPAAAGPAEPHASARPANPVRARVVFVKDAHHPFRSRVQWRAWRQGPGGRWRLVDHAGWRAGSGFGGPATTNECVHDRGWLPDGHYSFVQYDDYRGNLIKGRVFFLGNKACRNGTVRTDLFIHTETGAHNRPCADRPGDQVCRWEYPRINDYRSHGCVKMAPPDLLALTRHYHRWFRPGVRYPTARVQVVVRG